MPRRPVPSPPEARLSDSPLNETEVLEPWPGHPVEVDGTELNVRVTPAGPDAEPALCVHGLGGSSHNWTDIAGLLRDRLAIEAIDLPGFGRSGPSHSGYRLETQAAMVVDYLLTSGRGPVHLIGNSMGGAISILVAAQRPELIRTLTLVSPAVPDLKLRVHPVKHDPWLAAVVLPVVGPAALRRMRKVSPKTRARMTIELCFADASRFPERRMAEAVAETEYRLRFPWSDAAMLRSTRGIAWSQLVRGRAGWDTMRRIQAPTLVVWGDTDRLVPPDLAASVAGAIPNGRLLLLRDIGHTAQMEDPRTTARAILALIEDNAAGDPGAASEAVTRDCGSAVAT
jgi:pimeloyl-ACP methyl ester carboxylesterase